MKLKLSDFLPYDLIVGEIVNLVLKQNEKKTNKCLLEYLHQTRLQAACDYSSCKYSSLGLTVFPQILFGFLHLMHLHMTWHKPSLTIQRDSELSGTLLNPTAIYVNKQLHTQSSLHTQISYRGATWQMGCFRRQSTYASTENTSLLAIWAFQVLDLNMQHIQNPTKIPLKWKLIFWLLFFHQNFLLFSFPHLHQSDDLVFVASYLVQKNKEY